MTTQQSIKSSIARRFIFYIIIFSTVITLFITTVQIYRDYNSDIELIHNELEQINSVHLSSLSSALWASNTKLLQTSIEGILKIRDMQYVEIRDEDKIWAVAGKILGDNNIQRTYGMFFHHRNNNIDIGQLTVNVSLDGVYQRMLNKVLVILISNGIKTFLVAIFIYFLFYRLIARHLSTISDFSKSHNIQRNHQKLSLGRSTQSNDEFDVVVKSINDMQDRLYQQISEINYQRKYLSQTLDSIGDAVITTDQQGNITRLNPVAEKLTGWKSEDAVKQSLKTVFPIVNASTREPIENPVEKVLSTGETVYLNNHTTLIAKDGREIQIADSAAAIRDEHSILGMVLVFNDVTEQYQLRQALLESEKKLSLIHSQVPGIVYQFKMDNEGKKSLPYVSPAVESYIGLSAEEVMDDVEKWFALTHIDDFPSLENSIIESQKNMNAWNWEGRFVRDDGIVVYLNGTSTPEKQEDGCTLWYGLFIDVTERRYQEQQLRRSQKMDGLGKLSGGIAHDYNNILGIILGYAEQIDNNLGDRGKVKNYAQTIKRIAERGSELAKKLLSFSRYKEPSISTVNINKTLIENQQLLQKTITASHNLDFFLAENLWSVELDDGDLQDTMLNLSINAYHAMNVGGHLTISTSNESLSDKCVQQLSIPAGDYVLFSMRDTGCGMDEKTREKIFDPFFTTKGEVGTGLGLSQVYGFVERSSGAIRVHSEKGKGSRFDLYFPRSKQSLIPEKNEEVSSVINLGGCELLLVVDDEEDIVNLAVAIFELQGYKVLTAGDGKQAVDVLAKASEEKQTIDLIISDIVMPQMDGYQLAAYVKQHHPNIIMQMVSGFADERHSGLVDKHLQQNILHKPYRSNTLLKRVRSLLDQRQQPITLANCTLLILDDDEDIQTLYKIKLKKTGCHIISVFTSKDAIVAYEQRLNTESPVDIVIVDLSIPGDLSGNEVTEQIRKLHQTAKIIVASGDTFGAEMLRPQEHDFDAALEKNFDTNKLTNILEGVLNKKSD